MTAIARAEQPTAGTPGAPILEVRQVSKTFDGLTAVSACSLTVRQGTITGLIGPNGAGKTTLFNIISGFLKPTTGTIAFEGEQIESLPPHAIFHRGLVRTFQIPRALPGMTVLENLALVPEGQPGERVWNAWFRPGAVGRREREIVDQALEVLEFVDLIDLRDAYASHLSGGQKKLLELARALMARPKMIMLDEPGAGVNRTLMRRLIGYIEELCYERGITFLIIEHDMDLVGRLCNPVIAMCEGTPIAEGTPDEVRTNPQVLDAYLGSQHR